MKQAEINIKMLRDLVKSNKIIWTKHSLKRMEERKIFTDDVKNAISNGKIIEQYINDYPFPSCLILGCAMNKVLIHIVCGTNGETIYVVTVYYPNEDRWNFNKDMRG